LLQKIIAGRTSEAGMKGLARIVLISCGMLCVALAVLGIFLPVLPTTPFLLLASICFARSSQRFYSWLMTNRWFGKYIRNYREGRGVSLRHKTFAILLLWMTIGYAVLFAELKRWGKLILLGIAIGVTIHLLRIKTFKPEA